MTIEQLATIVMGELSWVNWCLIGLTIICLIGFATMAYKYHKLVEHIDGIEDVVDMIYHDVKKI